MAAGTKRGFSTIRNWIQSNQITFINTLVTIILITIVIAVLLIQASSLQRRTTEESLVNLAGMTAGEIQSAISYEFDAIRNVSQILGRYESIEITNRRNFLNETMRASINSNRGFLNLFSIWRENALDNMDAFYANTNYHDETGNFISGFTRARGWLEQRSFEGSRYVLDLPFIDNFGYGVELMSQPIAGRVVNPERTGEQSLTADLSIGDTCSVNIFIPVLGDASSMSVTWLTRAPEGFYRQSSQSTSGESSTTARINVLGVIGGTINLQPFQFLAERRKPLGTGNLIVCSNDGTIIAHPDSELRGTNVIDLDIIGVDELSKSGEAEEDSSAAEENPNLLWNKIHSSFDSMEPVVLTTKESLIVITPIRTSSSMTAFFTYSLINPPPWALITIVPMSTIMAPISALLRFSVLFVIGAGAVMVFVLLGTSRSLTQQAVHLRRGLEQASTMQDNLKYGLFLMDQKFIIQGAYSKALERILVVSNLEGKSLIELFSASMRETQKQGLMDYFEMVFKNAFDREMLEDINPINEFTYLNAEAGETKSLRTSFTLTERGRAGAFILGTMEDITAEKELQKQLAEAENIRENEMRSLFQVIQLDPRVLSDFVADAEYEFERINDMLKNKAQLHHEVLVEMYQAIHAIKSNALILNLESFSVRLHKLENSVKELRERPGEVVPFDDFLGLVLELNDAMREVDRLKATVSKIENFKNVSGGDKNQERYVLVETLTRVCNKTRVALNKKVRFVVEEIDDCVLEYGPRRALKEVLTQLVRNAVYHGIETPEEREPKGKEAEGEIRLSMKYKGGQITIRIADDGQGINFDRVRQTAVASKMLHNSNEANDKNYLLKAIFSPGFSTLDKADLHGGRGVGLSLVKDRVRDLHGNISITTATGKGTAFTITIPMELPAVNAS